MENIRIYTDLVNNAILLGIVLIIVGVVFALTMIFNNYEQDAIWLLVVWFCLIAYDLIPKVLSISELIVSDGKVIVKNKLSEIEEFLVQDISNIKFRNYTLIIYTKRKKYVGYFENEIGGDIAQKLLDIIAK